MPNIVTLDALSINLHYLWEGRANQAYWVVVGGGGRQLGMPLSIKLV